MSVLRIAYRNTRKIKDDQDEAVNELAKVLRDNHHRREMKKIQKELRKQNLKP